MGRGLGPVRTASKAMREFFRVTDKQRLTQAQISDIANIHQNQISNYRLGHNEPTIMRFEEMVEALGGRITIEFPDEV